MYFENKIEETDIKEIVNSKYINWDYFKNSTIMVTGATGLIGSLIVKSFLYANSTLNTNIKILALVRNQKKANYIFRNSKNKNLRFIVQDIIKPIQYTKKVDFIVHTANGTSSKSFVETPVETIYSIITGTDNVLKYSKNKRVKSIVYLSSMEVYGNISLDRQEPLAESDLGYINLSKTRSSYPEGKRLAENLCASYNQEFSVPVKIARLCQTIGAGVSYNDNRVFAQFARNIIEKQDIVLHTLGETTRSYCYITDAISAIFVLLEKGKNGEVYNVANPDTTCSIKEMAEMLCKKYPTSKLKFDSDNIYYPDTTKYYLDISKLINDTGWIPKISLEEMFSRLIKNFVHVKFSNANSKHAKNLWQSLFMLKNIKNKKVVKLLGLTFEINRNKYLKYCKDIPIEKNKIVFCNFKGAGYGCNPKYIAEEIIQRKLPYKLVWLTKNASEKQSEFPKEISIVEYGSKDAMKELATAKIWIDNQRKLFHISQGLEKKENQLYIQTWHGSLGIKKLAFDTTDNYSKTGWLPIGIDDAEMTDFVITNSSFEENIFTNRLWTKEKLKKFGHPRNDIFFYSKERTIEITEKLKNYFGISKNTKIISYVPTYRDNKDFSVYQINSKSIINSFEQKFGGEWKLIIRLHPQLKKYSSKIYDFSENIIDGSNYPDIQEILASSDSIITDYSSSVFDFMLSKKPAFVFAKDIEYYNTERGFYYPLHETPFSIATNDDELIKNIRDFDNEKYIKNVEAFLKDKGCIDDGYASERVVELVKEFMEK